VLAEAGLSRPEEELGAFLADPAGYKAALRPRLVSALVAQGEAALRQRGTARALAAFNRVLALEPENAAVMARLRTLARRARLRRAAGWAGVAALVAALAAGGARRGIRAAGPRPLPSATAPRQTPSRPRAPARRPHCRTDRPRP
jgi:serine/threonine-protein kinase